VHLLPNRSPVHTCTGMSNDNCTVSVMIHFYSVIYNTGLQQK
jgi:hypothetical protein